VRAQRCAILPLRFMAPAAPSAQQMTPLNRGVLLALSFVSLSDAAQGNVMCVCVWRGQWGMRSLPAAPLLLGL